MRRRDVLYRPDTRWWLIRLLTHYLQLGQRSMTKLSTWKKIFSCLMVFTCFYYLSGFSGHSDRFWRQRTPVARPHNGYQSSDGATCQVIEVAIPCFTQDQVHNMTTLLKSILFHTYQPLKLHFFTTTTNYRGLVSLFTTWQLRQVRTNFHIMETDELSRDPIHDIVKTFLQKNPNVNKLMIVRPELVFMTDILAIWKRLDSKSYEVFGFLEPYKFPPGKPPKKRKKKAQLPPLMQMAFLNLDKFRNVCNGDYRGSADGPSYQDRYKRLCRYSTLNEQLQLRAADLQWNSTLKKSPVIKVNEVFESASRANPEFPIDEYNQITRLDGEMFRNLSYRCAKIKPKKATPKPIVWPPLRIPRKKSPKVDDCRAFNYHYKLVYRTHPCFLGEEIIDKEKDDNDITLVTQLQYNRIDALEKMLHYWTGPASVAVYVDDDGALKFKNYIMKSKFLSNRKQVSYHLVYRRGKYYPINFVRNVAIKEVRTPYLFMLDVDFIGPPDLYERLKAHLSAMNLSTSRGLLVPTFRTNNDSYIIAQTKDDFLEHINRSIVTPYHITNKKAKFTAGHRYHNYAKWQQATAPYKVAYKFGFEPYMVLPSDCPLYHEELLERMKDKISYTYEIDKAGYELFVLNDVYIVHLPHPLSLSHSWNKDRKFNLCTRRYYQKIVRRLDSKYPDASSS